MEASLAYGVALVLLLRPGALPASSGVTGVDSLLSRDQSAAQGCDNDSCRYEKDTDTHVNDEELGRELKDLMSEVVTKGLKLCPFDRNFDMCLKLSMLQKMNDVLYEMKRVNDSERNQSFQFFGGSVSLDVASNYSQAYGERGVFSGDLLGLFDLRETEGTKEKRLDSLLVSGITKIFHDKVLSVKLIPGVEIRVFSSRDRPGFVNVSLKFGNYSQGEEARKKSQMSGFMPMMMLGPLISYGMFPFMWSNLNMLVMKAVMMNNMVLGMALFNTIRDLVFGPRPGPKVVYKNHGYRRAPVIQHHHVQNRPVHDLHSQFSEVRPIYIKLNQMTPPPLSKNVPNYLKDTSTPTKISDGNIYGHSSLDPGSNSQNFRHENAPLQSLFQGSFSRNPQNHILSPSDTNSKESDPSYSFQGSFPSDPQEDLKYEGSSLVSHVTQTEWPRIPPPKDMHISYSVGYNTASNLRPSPEVTDETSHFLPKYSFPVESSATNNGFHEFSQQISPDYRPFTSFVNGGNILSDSHQQVYNTISHSYPYSQEQNNIPQDIQYQNPSYTISQEQNKIYLNSQRQKKHSDLVTLEQEHIHPDNQEQNISYLDIQVHNKNYQDILEKNNEHDYSQAQSYNYQDSQNQDGSYEDIQEQNHSYQDDLEQKHISQDSQEQIKGYEDSQEQNTVYEGSQIKIPSQQGSQEQNTVYEGSQIKIPSQQGSQEQINGYEGSQEPNTVYEGSQIKIPSQQGSQEQNNGYEGSQIKIPSQQGSQEQNTVYEGSQIKIPSQQGSQEQNNGYEGSQEQNTVYEGSQIKIPSQQGSQEQNNGYEGSQEQNNDYEDIREQNNDYEDSHEQHNGYEDSQVKNPSHQDSQKQKHSSKDSQKQEHDDSDRFYQTEEPSFGVRLRVRPHKSK